MEDFGHESPSGGQVPRSSKKEEVRWRIRTARLRIDEDVEAHANKGSHKLANDEGDDVEGHMHKSSHKASHKLANDEGDDVEGHMHKQQANKGMHKP